MLRQLFTRVGAPAVAAAALLMTGPAWAQHGGGGHGGGGHGGGFHGGGLHGSGGFQHGGLHSGSFHNHSFHHSGLHDGRFHRGGYYPGYGYYSGYGYYPAYEYGDFGYYPPTSYYPSDDLVYDSASVSSDTALAEPDLTALVTVRVPAGAELWIDGSSTTSTGSVREFRSPPLAPGNYAYEVRARWTENGRDIAQTQKVAVSQGAHVAVHFPAGSGTD